MKHCATCQLIFADHTQLCPNDGTALRLVEEIQPGMIVRGKYRIIERIGAGGMAVVYRARHELLNEERAIKMVLPKYASDRDFLKRFRHEAAVARKLRHENAVWVEDLDETEDGRPFIAMELLRGCDLGELVRKEGPFSVERTLALASQIASALGAAHELGIVHRDMKPDNVFITVGKRGQEVAKVLDFGIAKAMETPAEGAGYTLTKAGMIMGTPQYISPEQAMGKAGGKLDGRADLYSLGIVIYEMLTGRLPFESDTPMGMVLHHINTKPKPPHELMPALRIPEPVSLVLMRALEKDPAKRFQTADELAQALRNPSVWATTAVLGSASPAAPIEAATVAAWPVPAAQTVARPPEMASRKDVSLPASGHRVRPPASVQAGAGKGRFRIWMAVAALTLIAGIGVALFSVRQNSAARIELQTPAEKGGTAGAAKSQQQPVAEAGVSLPPPSNPACPGPWRSWPPTSGSKCNP